MISISAGYHFSSMHLGRYDCSEWTNKGRIDDSLQSHVLTQLLQQTIVFRCCRVFAEPRWKLYHLTD